MKVTIVIGESMTLYIVYRDTLENLKEDLNTRLLMKVIFKAMIARLDKYREISWKESKKSNNTFSLIF
jgi:hypothetical protein